MKTDFDHDAIEVLIAAESLDGLDDADVLELQRLRAEHGATCPECRRLESEYAGVAERLALALDPLPVPKGMEDRVAGLATGSIAPLTREERPGEWVLPARRDLVKRWVAAVAAVVALVAGAVGGYLAASAADGNQAEVLAFVAEPGTRVARFTGDAQGSLAVVYRPGEDLSYVLGKDLEDPPTGRDYQLWTIRDGQPVSQGTFEPDDGSLVLEVPADPSAADVMAVTVEVDGGVPAPEGPIVFQTPITA
jgi:anti-sigma-K factor RskA